MKLLSLFFMVSLISMVLAAGCTDEKKTGPVFPAPDAVLPGQVIGLSGM